MSNYVSVTALCYLCTAGHGFFLISYPANRHFSKKKATPKNVYDTWLHSINKPLKQESRVQYVTTCIPVSTCNQAMPPISLSHCLIPTEREKAHAVNYDIRTSISFVPIRPCCAKIRERTSA